MSKDNKKNKPVTRTFSFTEDEKDLLDHIDGQSNKSAYIKGLVRSDMSKQSNEELILEQMKEFLSGIKVNK